MRDLRRSLLQHDIALLRVIGESWGADLLGLPPRMAAKRLVEVILSADLSADIADLPSEVQAAVQALLAAGGRIAVDSFTRQFGSIRPFGPARMERERPWANPDSPAEVLWYHGLLFRAFDQIESGSQEFVYLPDEVFAALPAAAAPPPMEQPQLVPAAGLIGSRSPIAGLVDDCCTLLAFVQRTLVSIHPHGTIPEDLLLPHLCYKDRARLQMIWALALDAGLLQADGKAIRPHTQIARAWMQAPYPEQAATLVQAWLDSRRWNDLWQVPSLQPEAAGWQNDPRYPRRLMLEVLAQLDPKIWWQLDSLLTGVKAARPNFQRSAGEFDAWYIRDASTGHYLRGFDFWDQVEGALLRYLVTGPLAWLEMVELGEDEEGAVVAFRPTAAGRTFAQVRTFPYPAGPADARIRVYADATVVVPAAVNRFTRFQAARLTDWEPLGGRATVYRYRITPRSLERAKKAGIPISRALTFLASRSGRPLPESVAKAVESWQEHGAQIRLRQAKLLQVRDPAVLDRLRAAPGVRPLLGETVGPLAVIVRPTDWSRLISAIAELGLLSEVDEGETN